MRINVHSWKDYKSCPRKFNMKHILREPSQVPENKYFALYGMLMEKFFEFFCNDWRFKTPYMPSDYIKKKMGDIFPSILRTNAVIWSAPFVKLSEDQILEQAVKDACTIMESHNQNYFLNSRSEISISLNMKEGDVLTGRIDFIHSEPVGKDVDTIIDGKGTDKIGIGVDNDQLLFYTLLYFFQYKRMPVCTGFFYYRYNTFIPVEINMDIMESFRARLSLDMKTIKTDATFEATPSSKACKYCEYAPSCEARIKKASGKKKIKIDVPNDGREDTHEFGF